MAIARKHTVSETEDGIYHCTTRCVRRAFLAGYDSYSNKNYEYRKKWIQERLKYVSEIFKIDVLNYAVMSNHLHVLIRTDYKGRDELSDREVAERWCKLYRREVEFLDNKEEYIKIMLMDRLLINTYRYRLGNISWFMRSINEYIARRANKEDECKGRFWEGRFYCQKVIGEGAILQTSMYIDLNPVRAKVAETPEESKYTSIYDRIEAKRAKDVINEKKYKTQNRKKKLKEAINQDKWLAPLSNKDNPKGYLNMTFEEYLSLIDWTGRCLAEGKKGTIPSELSPILERLKISEVDFTDRMKSFCKKFHRVIAREDKLEEVALTQGSRWIQGVVSARMFFI